MIMIVALVLLQFFGRARLPPSMASSVFREGEAPAEHGVRLGGSLALPYSEVMDH
jgi:hypothetical protein